MKNYCSLNLFLIVVLLSCTKPDKPIVTTVIDKESPFLYLDSLSDGQHIKPLLPLNMKGYAADNIAIKELHLHVTDVTHNISVFHDRTNSNAKRIDYEKYFITDTNTEYHIQIAAFDSALNASYVDIVVNTK